MSGLCERLRSLVPAHALGRPAVVVAALGVLFALVCAQRAALPVHDPDVWWLVAVGRDFIGQSKLPHTSFYSFTAPDQPWVTHEWGFAALYAGGLSLLGPAFFSLLGLACAALVSLLVIRLATARARHPAAGALAALLSIAAAAPAMFEPRPAYASLVFPVTLAGLAFAPRFALRHALAATGLVWLWAQCHGSFVLGVALLAASALTEPELPGARKVRLAAAGMSLLAALLNPYGLEPSAWWPDTSPAAIPTQACCCRASRSLRRSGARPRRTATRSTTRCWVPPPCSPPCR